MNVSETVAMLMGAKALTDKAMARADEFMMATKPDDSPISESDMDFIKIGEAAGVAGCLLELVNAGVINPEKWKSYLTKLSEEK